MRALVEHPQQIGLDVRERVLPSRFAIVSPTLAEHSAHSSSGCGWYGGATVAEPSSAASNASTVMPIRIAMSRQWDRLM